MSARRPKHPAGASRILVSGMSLAGTLAAVAGMSYAAQAEQAQKAEQDAGAMREWNREQRTAAAKARRAATLAARKPVVVSRTIYREVPALATGGTASAAAPAPGTTTSGGSTTGSSSGGSAPAPAPAPAAPAPAAPPPPATGSGAS